MSRAGRAAGRHQILSQRRVADAGGAGAGGYHSFLRRRRGRAPDAPGRSSGADRERDEARRGVRVRAFRGGIPEGKRRAAGAGVDGRILRDELVGESPLDGRLHGIAEAPDQQRRETVQHEGRVVLPHAFQRRRGQAHGHPRRHSAGNQRRPGWRPRGQSDRARGRRGEKAADHRVGLRAPRGRTRLRFHRRTFSPRLGQ